MTPGELGVHSFTGRMLDVIRRDDTDGLAGLLSDLVGTCAPQRHLFEPVLRELVVVIVRALERRAGTAEAAVGDTYAVDLWDSADGPVAIDQVQPALRAMLRAVLAALNEDSGDSRFQLGLVLDDPDPLARVDALLHALVWADGLAHEPA